VWESQFGARLGDLTARLRIRTQAGKEFYAKKEENMQDANSILIRLVWPL
jgi:hypothetical protein